MRQFLLIEVVVDPENTARQDYSMGPHDFTLPPGTVTSPVVIVNEDEAAEMIEKAEREIRSFTVL